MADKQIIDPSHSIRLKAIISHVGAKSANEFAKGIDGLQSEISRILSGQRELSPALAYKIAKSHRSFRIEWIIDGEGEMLKLEKVDNLSPNENEPLEADTTFFSSNLSVLLQAREMTPANLAPLIGIELETLTSLVEGHRGPSLPLLVRLRRVLGVAIDTMLFDDLSQPGSMDNLHEKQTQQQQQDELQKTLEAILRRLERLEEKEREKEEDDRTKGIDKEK